MPRKKAPKKPAQKWFAVTILFFIPEATSDFIALPLPSLRADTEDEAIVQAKQHIDRRWFDMKEGEYFTDDEDGYKMHVWKLIVVEIPAPYSLRLESEWQYDRREERKEAKMSNAQPVRILDFQSHALNARGRKATPDGDPTGPKK